MKQSEINAAGALLDSRSVRILMPTPFFLRWFGIRTLPVCIRYTVFQQLLRISRLFNKMDIDLKKLDEGDVMYLFSRIAENGVTASRIIALGMVRSWLAVKLFVPPLAWYLRTHMDARSLAELTKVVVVISNGEDFTSIIRSVASMSVTAPTLSQEKTES